MCRAYYILTLSSYDVQVDSVKINVILVQMNETSAIRPHHHGNLRNALISAGLELLQEDGADALTLRKCAALAGVSHAAPAHHFNGLISLKVAIIARGHVLFAAMMRQSCDQADASPHSQLNAICDGYISFARSHTALFRFMFHPHGDIPIGIDKTTLAEIRQASFASYDLLHRACLPFEHEGKATVNTETMVWSLVHGYAMLFVGAGAAQSPGETVPDFSKILPKLRLKTNSGI